MSTYRVDNHHGVTICREDDDHRCDRPGHDCARGHLVAIVVNGDVELAERICAALNSVEAYAYVCLGCGKPYRMPLRAYAKRHGAVS